MTAGFHLDGHETEQKTFSNLIFLPYHPIFFHFMDRSFSLFLLITVAFTGADLSTTSWIHSLSTEMVERLLNEIVLHYVLWPTILLLWCSFITVILFFQIYYLPCSFMTITFYHFHSPLLQSLSLPLFSYFPCSAHQNTTHNKVTCSHGSITQDTVLSTGLQ